MRCFSAILISIYLLYLYILQLYLADQITTISPKRVVASPLHVDSIYVINLERRPERLKSFVDSLCRTDLNTTTVERIEAVDGNAIDFSTIDIDETAIQLLYASQLTGARQTHSELTVGAIGCYLSHFHAWELIRSRNQSFAIVCEDDAVIPVNMLEKIQIAMQYVPADWDLILGGYMAFNENYMDLMFSTTVIPLFDTIQPTIRKIRHFFGLHFYIIRARTVDKIRPTFFPIQYQLDAFLSKSNLNIYTLGSNLVRQSDSPTDIQTTQSKTNALG